MKKVILWAALAAMALTSCLQEKSVDTHTLTKDDVAFVLQGGSATRASEAESPVREGVTVKVGQIGDVALTLEETVIDLDCAVPETKGTPVYTENVGYLYKDRLGVYSDTQGGVEASYTRLSDQPVSGGWPYYHHYDVNIWVDETTPVTFHLRMPSDMDTHGASSLSYAHGVTTVGSYTSPTTAAEQQDIIFGGIQLTHKQYKDRYFPEGARVVMYHALTGIKFAIKNTAAELARIQIRKISFIGLKNKGSFTFTVPAEGNYGTTKSADVITWTSATADEGNVISQTFEAGDLVTYDSAAPGDNHFAASFYGGGTSQNLNKADASYTFWLVPQSITGSDATLKIEYTMSGKDEEMEIRLGDLKAQDWKAGQLRTYTFKLDEVKIKIEDTVTMAEKTQQPITTPWGDKQCDSYEGSTKTAVTITNTGNTDAFIRAALIGQWRNQAGDPVFGFTDYTHGVQLVASWYEDQFVNKTCLQGRFTGLPGTKWVLNETDGYYYYTEPVPAGQAVPHPLFTEYKVGKAPAAAIAGEVQDIYFTLEIATQAISARKLDGTHYTYTEAWARALADE